MKHTYKVGDRVRLIRLDGTLSETAFPIHDLWGNETSNRNCSFIFDGMESYFHTDLLKREDDTTPVIVPDGGEWFIARGNNMAWGRAQTEKQAVLNMKRQGGTITAYTVHRVSKWTQVDGMGSLTYPTGIDPVEVTSVDTRKKKART